MTVLYDSYAWIEIFDDLEKEKNFRENRKIICSAINLYEVYSKFLKVSKLTAGLAISFIKANAEIFPVTDNICLRAAGLRQKYKFSMADSLILATAEENKASLLTGDKDFKNVDEVEVEFI